MFEGCTVKYKKSKFTGKVNQVSVTYPEDKDGNKWHMAIPIDTSNSDYQDILKWVEDGNTIADAD